MSTTYMGRCTRLRIENKAKVTCLATKNMCTGLSDFSSQPIEFLESNDIFNLPLMQAFSLQGGPAVLPIKELLKEAAEVN